MPQNKDHYFARFECKCGFSSPYYITMEKHFAMHEAGKN